MKRPAFPTLATPRARIRSPRYEGCGRCRPAQLCARCRCRTSPTRIAGGYTYDAFWAWRLDRLRALWAALPWRDGAIEWSFAEEPTPRLVCRWRSPRREGELRLAPADITEWIDD